jgi:hypothetical protein
MNNSHVMAVIHMGDYFLPTDFPSLKIAPILDADVTEQRAMRDVGAIAQDFALALQSTTNVNRSYQIRERITACIQILAKVEREAFDQVDALSEAKGNV